MSVNLNVGSASDQRTKIEEFIDDLILLCEESDEVAKGTTHRAKAIGLNQMLVINSAFQKSPVVETEARPLELNQALSAHPAHPYMAVHDFHLDSSIIKSQNRDDDLSVRLAMKNKQEYITWELLAILQVPIYPDYLFYAVQNGWRRIIDILISRKDEVDINTQESRLGLTPLHLAVFIGNIDMVKYLIEDAGAKVDVLDNNGWTPFLIACFYSLKDSQRRKIVDYLFPKVNQQIEVKLGRKSLNFIQIILLGKACLLIMSNREENKKEAYHLLRFYPVCRRIDRLKIVLKSFKREKAV